MTDPGSTGSRRAVFALYPLLSLLAFPTLGAILVGTRGWTYALDVFDDGGGVPRLGIAVRGWSAHGLTLWDPYLTAGNAFLGQVALPPLGLDVAMAFLVGPFAAFAIMVWITSTLAGIGMHLFLRDRLGLSTPAVVAGSIIAVLGFWHSIYGISVAVLPLILWLGDRAAGSAAGIRANSAGATRWRASVGAVLLGALVLYAGHVQVVVFLVAIQLAWIVTTAERGHLRGRIARFALTWALSFALYGPVLVTQLVLLPLSNRTVWDLQYLFGSTFGEALLTIAGHYEGFLFGVPVTPFGPSAPRYGTIFLGGLGLALAVLGVVAGRRGRAAWFIVLLLIAIPVLDLAATIGAGLQEQLGIVRSVQFVRIRHFFPFAIAATAALGVEVVAGRRAARGAGRDAGRGASPGTGSGESAMLRPGSRRRWVAIALMILVLVPVAIQVAVATRQGLAGLRSFQATTPADMAWILGAAGLAIGLVGGIGLIVLVVRGGGRPLARTVVLGLGLLLAGDRLLLSHAVPLVGRNISTFDERLGLTPAQAFLLGQPGIASNRVLTFGDNANRMAFQGLLQADGYQAIYPLAYHGFFGAMTAPGLALDPDRFQYFHSWGGRAYAFRPEVDPELTSLAGVRWLYVRANPGTSVPTVPGLVERFSDPDVTVYENPAAMSRAFLVGSIAAEPDQAAVVAALGGASLDDLRGSAFATTAEVARLGAAAQAALGAPSGVAGSATIVEDTPDRIVVDIAPDRPAVLVLTDAASPGWIAEVDGQAAPIATVDGAFRGVAIGIEARRVVFAYRPTFTALGGLAALLALLVLAGWAFVERRRDRPDPAPSPTLSNSPIEPRRQPGDDDA